MSIHEKDESDKVGTTLLEQLKGLLAGEAPSCVTQAQRTKQINKLMTELQARKRLGWVKSKTGQLPSDPLAIASALEQHWSGVTRPGLGSSEECRRYLDQLKLPPNFSVMARALFRPLTPALVSEALDRLHNSSSPGEDGVGAGFYKCFREFFEPLMFQLCDTAFNSGSLPEGWETGLINIIPKAAGLASIDKLRPNALQNVKKKWLMTIVAMQIEQIIQQLSHKQQVGCIKGRHMIQHIWGVKGGFESLDKGLLVSFDFSNAFPTLSHVFIEAVLHKIQIPLFHVHFILATLVAPYHFCVGKGIVREVLFTPGAGIGQGDPFSPLLFSFCASFVLFAFDSVSSAFPFMYVDDLCVLITSNFAPSLRSILDSMNEFGRISGLCLNLSKSAMVIKGKFSESDIKSFKSCGLTMADSVRYLGVLIGHVTTAQAFARALGEAQRRASQLSLFPLTLLERVQLLKVWILPVLLLTARAYRASEQEERSLKPVYNTALGFDSWGVTLTQLSLQPDSGGHGLAPPDTWLRVQSGLAFARFSGHQSEFPPFVTLIFRQWARKYGVVWTPRAVPYLQLGPVPYASMGFLAQSLKSFSQARRYVLDGMLPGTTSDALPLWHSAIFRNADNLTYYCPRLIKRGILTVKDLFDTTAQPKAKLLSMMRQTWQAVYPASLLTFQGLPSSEWSLNSVWVGSWGKSASLKKMAPVPYVPHRQPSQV